MTAFHSGGCQCGAVRFRASKFGRASICHCRMCQKAFGSFFGALVTAYDLEWTRGAPKHFQSSNKVKRGFCAECGTPLTFEPPSSGVELAVGAFDDPTVVPPTIQLNPNDKLSFYDGICTLPMRPPGSEPHIESFKDSLVNYQHPDHDTAVWPPKDRQ
jgi:hypothetical protein